MIKSINPSKLLSRQILLLVLLLVIGPVQAQTMFACNMMGVQMMENECCCDEVDFSDDTAVVSDQICCEAQIALTIDHSEGETSVGSKSVDVRSDVDPPQSFIVAHSSSLSLNVFSAIAPAITPVYNIHAGSKTYLATQRLRL